MGFRKVNVEITSEHFDRSIKGSPVDAIKELIWNACDADAEKIEITFESDGIAGVENVSDIYIKDDGHGIPYERVEEYFGKYGRSQKTYTDKSPSGRIYHGKLGQGRYKSLEIGTFVDWHTVSRNEEGIFVAYDIYITSGSRLEVTYSDQPEIAAEQQAGTIVHIHGIHDDRMKTISQIADPQEMIPELLVSFAPYLMAYTDITIKYNGVTINPSQQVKKQAEREMVYSSQNESSIKIRAIAITWRQSKFNKLYICGNSGVVYAEQSHTLLNNTSTSLYLLGEYYENLHRQNLLDLGRAQAPYEYFDHEAKKFLREFISTQEAEDAATEISIIKEEGIYPYEGEPEDEVKKAEREVFDVFAVHVNRAVPQLKTSPRQTKKLTYRLIREAINTNPSSIKTILTEVFNLTQQQQDDLAELLTHTHLPEIIDTAKTVSDRLIFLQVLEQMVYNDSVGKPIKERTQFHRVLLKHLWIFGEKYTLGTSDQSLRNVLKAHINYLGRDEVTPEIPPEAVEDLTRIPDLCLFQQICPNYENFEHLVIELKRPTLTLTMKELDQIRDYALTVAEHPMFDKARTKWHFVLLGQRFDQRVRSALENQVFGDGNYYNAGNISISVFEWSKIIQDNKLKYEYLRKKLNHQLSDDPEFVVDYLHTKHAELFSAKEKEAT